MSDVALEETVSLTRISHFLTVSIGPHRCSHRQRPQRHGTQGGYHQVVNAPGDQHSCTECTGILVPVGTGVCVAERRGAAFLCRNAGTRNLSTLTFHRPQPCICASVVCCLRQKHPCSLGRLSRPMI